MYTVNRLLSSVFVNIYFVVRPGRHLIVALIGGRLTIQAPKTR